MNCEYHGTPKQRLLNDYGRALASRVRAQRSLRREPAEETPVFLELPRTVSIEQVAAEYGELREQLGLLRGADMQRPIITRFERSDSGKAEDFMYALSAKMYRAANDAFSRRYTGVCCIDLNEWCMHPDDNALRDLFSCISASADRTAYLLFINRGRKGAGELVGSAMSFFDLEHIVLSDESVSFEERLQATANGCRFALGEGCLELLDASRVKLEEGGLFSVARAGELIVHRLEDTLLELRDRSPGQRVVEPGDLERVSVKSEWLGALTRTASHRRIGFANGEEADNEYA